MKTVADLIAALAKGKGAKFAGFKYQAKESHEVARHTVILGAKLEVLYQKDIEALTGIVDGLTGIELQAAQAILASRHKSLEAMAKGQTNPDYTAAGVYIHPEGLPGVKVHIVTGELYVDCLQEHKVIIVPGEYKEVNSSPLTIAKRQITKQLPGGRFRQFILRNVQTAKMNGETLEIDSEPILAND